MTTESNKDLSIETAEALLNAIKEAAPDAHRRSTEALESLGKAYASVVDAMPKRSGSGRGVIA